jgi:transcriptional regulator GlxA family with amidase domain
MVAGAEAKGQYMITIGIPVYEQVDLLDVTGPYEMFQWVNEYGPPVDVQLIAETAGEVTSRKGSSPAGMTFKARYGFADVTALDVLWVPGGDPGALQVLMRRPNRYLDFLIAQGRTARYVASVCEGALLLAAAGLLDGYQATTHWAFVPCLKQFPAVKVVEGHPRFVVDRNRLTGGGISSGLDEALKLVELIGGTQCAQGVQQVTQYYPDPPVASTIPRASECPFAW